MNQTGYFLLGSRSGGKNQLGLEQEAVPGRDLQPLARPESHLLELVRRIGIDGPYQVPVGAVEPQPAGRADVGPARQEEAAIGAHGHVMAAACLGEPLDRTAGLDAIKVGRHGVVARGGEVAPAGLRIDVFERRGSPTGRR